MPLEYEQEFEQSEYYDEYYDDDDGWLESTEVGFDLEQGC